MATDNKNLADMKLPIGIMAVVLMQFGAAVWWSRGQVANIESLTAKVIEIDNRMTIEAQVNLRRDLDDLISDNQNIDDMEKIVEDLEIRVSVLERNMENAWSEIDALYGDYIDLVDILAKTE